jgi:PAS domain S-box-containing protein
MNWPRLASSYRGKLFLGLGLTVLVTLSFGFYVIFKTSHAQAILNDTDLLTSSQQETLSKDINDLTNIAFYYFSISLILITGLLIYLSFSLESYLKTILRGIAKINNGDLSYRINLDLRNEFGTLAKFINNATAHVEGIVTERTKQLVAEKHKLETILSAITDGVIALDTDRKIIAINKNALHLLGVRSDKELLGKSISNTFSIYSSSNNPIVSTEYAPVLSNKEGIVFKQNSVKLVRNDRRVFYVNLIASQIKEAQSVNLGCLLTIHDLTSTHNLEEMKLDFVSIAAHELRTPLTTTMGYLQLLKSTENEANRQYVERAVSSTKNLVGLIDKLLNVTHIENNQFVMEQEKLDIVNLVEDSYKMHQLTANQANVNLKLDSPKKEIYVKGDSIRLKEVLNNLITNAFKYTPATGTISITVRKLKDRVSVAVEDTGIGISQENSSKLFNKFVRIDSGLASSNRGTGLGLFISKSIIKMHHGTINVESALGKGSVFEFTLPIYEKNKLNK